MKVLVSIIVVVLAFMACDVSPKKKNIQVGLLLMYMSTKCQQVYGETPFGNILIPEFRCNNHNIEFCNENNEWEITNYNACDILGGDL